MDTQEMDVFQKMLDIVLLYGLGTQREPIKAIPKKKIEDLFAQGISQA